MALHENKPVVEYTVVTSLVVDSGVLVTTVVVSFSVVEGVAVGVGFAVVTRVDDISVVSGVAEKLYRERLLRGDF